MTHEFRIGSIAHFFIAVWFAALLALAVDGCGSTPINPSPAGGVSSVGGATASGGSVATGGTQSASTAATGGATVASSTSSPTLAFLDCNPASSAGKAKAHHNLSGWHRNPDRAKHARQLASYSVVAPSSFPRANVAVNLNQAKLGSCTGNAPAQCLSTWPFDAQLTEADAIKIYIKATEIDNFRGTYPPTDTGSDGASAARAAKLLGYTTIDFEPVYTLEDLQRRLQSSTCIIGVDWYEGFSIPTLCGEMRMTGKVEGGHEIQVAFWDAELKRVGIRNSWMDWGNKRTGTNDTGYAYWSAGTLQKLVNAGAEIDCPIVKGDL